MRPLAFAPALTPAFASFILPLPTRPRPRPCARPRTLAWTCSAATNAALVDNLVAAGLVRTPRVEAAMRAVDRRLFVPASQPRPYDDAPHRLPCAATISAPHMHAMALELLQAHLHPGAVALDVGAGSGYLTACMAAMVGHTGCVVAVEHVPDLARLAQRNLRAFDEPLLQQGTVVVRAADGRQGAADKGPFAAIHVGAAAPNIPHALVSQLAPNGAMVIPVGETAASQNLVLVTKDAHGSVTERTVCGVRYVPLCDLDPHLRAS